jgi:hypothetical protein
MRVLKEWRYEFFLAPEEEDGTIPREVAEELIFDVAALWAEANELFVGGGPREWWGRWHYTFGLCGLHEVRQIPEDKANELLELLRRFATRNGCRLVGGVGEFPSEPTP